MRCFKAFGKRIMARDPDRQTAEIHIHIALMNRFNAPGTAEIVRAQSRQWGKGKACLKHGFCNNATCEKERTALGSEHMNSLLTISNM